MYVRDRTPDRGLAPQQCRAVPKARMVSYRRQAEVCRARRRTVPEGGTMSTETAVTMQDLELESAELLPTRETLCASPCYHPCCPPPCFDLSVCIRICC